MVRRQTYWDRLRGKPPGAEALAERWTEALIEKLLEFVWTGYDSIHATVWSQLDWTQSYDDLERSLSEALAQAINEVMNRHFPVYVQHGPYERETRKDPPAQPKQYDIAFKWIDDPRIIWPLEGKVLKSDRDTEENLGDYIETLQSRYLSGDYAPFSASGAMLGYLQSGDAETVIGHIEVRLGTPLTVYPVFPSRCHKTSDHQRAIPAGKDYPVAFRCHHLILPLQ